MIIEIKDMPSQKIKSVDIHIDFLESETNADYTPKISYQKDDTIRANNSDEVKNVEIPNEMLNGEF